MANNDFWENEKTRLVATWILNELDYCELARKFVMKNSDEPVIYRAWIKHKKLENFVTPKAFAFLIQISNLESWAMYYEHSYTN